MVSQFTEEASNERDRRYASVNKVMKNVKYARAQELVFDALFLNFWKNKKDPKVLEIGAGSGYVTNNLLNVFPEIKVWYATDPSEGRLRAIKKDMSVFRRLLDRRIKLVTGDARKILDEFSSPSKKVDVALSHAAFHHMVEISENKKLNRKASHNYQQSVIRGMANCLKPGGKLLIADVPASFSHFKGKVYFDTYHEDYLKRISDRLESGFTSRMLRYNRIYNIILESLSKGSPALSNLSKYFPSELKKILSNIPPGLISPNMPFSEVLAKLDTISEDYSVQLIEVINRSLGPFKYDASVGSITLDEKRFKGLIKSKKVAEYPYDERSFFDDIVSRYSITPHIVRFADPTEMYRWLRNAGLSHVFVGILPTPWNFSRDYKDMIHFVRNTFGIATKEDVKNGLQTEYLSDNELYNVIKEYLGFTSQGNMRWELMYAYGEKPEK